MRVGADNDVGEAELALARAKAGRAIPLWAVASAFGLLICAMLGVGLIEAIAKERPSGEFIRT